VGHDLDALAPRAGVEMAAQGLVRQAMILRTVSKTTGRIHWRVERTNSAQCASKRAAILYRISEPTASIGARRYLLPRPPSPQLKRTATSHAVTMVRARQRANYFPRKN